LTAVLLDGERVAQDIKRSLAKEVEILKLQGITPGLGTILVGDHRPSLRYVEMKHSDCEEVGMTSFHRHLPSTTSQRELLDVIKELNENTEVDAFLVQLPLPEGLDEWQTLLAIDPIKDVDGLHPINLGRLTLGLDGPRPCAPLGIIELLKAYEVPVEGKNAVIIGRGVTVGAPLALLLSLNLPGCNAAVTILHKGIDNIEPYLKKADLVIAAAGSPHLVKAHMLSKGVAVVGVGVSWEGKKLISDLADDVKEVAGFVTPRLGGVGPMTRAMLLANTVSAAKKRYIAKG